MKFTAATILVFGVTVTVTGRNTDKLSECKIFLLGKPDDDDCSTIQEFQGTFEVTLQTGNRNWSKFALGFNSEDKRPIGYLQIEKKGHAIDMTLMNWKSSHQNETQNITGHTRDMFVEWTTITLEHLNGFLHVSVDKVFEITFIQVHAEPFKFVYAHVLANQYINVTMNCKRHGQSNIHDQPNPPEKVTFIDLSPTTTPKTPELQTGLTTVTVIVILLVVAAATGGYCFWKKKGSFHTMKEKKKQDDDTEDVNHTLLYQDPNARSTGNDTDFIKLSLFEGFSQSYNEDQGQKNEYERKITEDSSKLEPEDDRITEDNNRPEPEEERNSVNISEHLNEIPDSETINKTPQTEDDSRFQDFESQIIPRKLSITKMDMNYQKNFIGPIPEEKPLCIEQAQNLTEQSAEDEVIDVVAALSMDEQTEKDNHGIGKDSGNNTKGFPLNKKDNQNDSTPTNEQMVQGLPENNYPEITNHALEKTEVIHEEPVAYKVVLKLGETEGTIPTKLEEIQNSTTTLDTHDDSRLQDFERQIIPRKKSITKMDMNSQSNLIGPSPEEKPLSTEQAQNLTEQSAENEVIDAMAALNINEQTEKDNHRIGKDLENKTEGFPLNKNDTQNESTPTNEQMVQGHPENNYPEITNHALEKRQVIHEEPVANKVVLKLGETEGTIPTKLEEIQNSTTTLDTDDDSRPQDIEEQITPRLLSITKVDMNSQSNLIDPIHEEKPLSIEQPQNLTEQSAEDEVIDAIAELNINEQTEKDNHGIGKDLENKTEGFPLNKKDTQNESTPTNEQMVQGHPENNYPEITNHALEKRQVIHEEPVANKVVLKLGETEGTIPTKLEEIQNSTTTLDTHDDSRLQDFERQIIPRKKIYNNNGHELSKQPYWP
ncbi:probable serine/threonine-protein kinase kinX [Palaemon carinicauda]|uniref:probable serine/threonine-protein kinase kinX n=1 Tax=Palaemon carinicauda TaxID=392227 RepID=UPI0035B63FE0